MPDPAPVTIATFSWFVIAGRYRSAMRRRRATPRFRSRGCGLVIATAIAVAFVGVASPGAGGADRAFAAEPDADDTRVELLAPGAAPRAPLRITAPVGEVSAVTMVQDLEITQSIDGRQQRAIPVSASVGMR